ncbi:hypothetical protein FRB99_004841 [Tulasnella sp. 403]|nr:hypothetical protein FRB99_004841 [Tulasnella sp. 403]
MLSLTVRKPKLFTAASVASTEDASTTPDPVEPQPPAVLAPAPTETVEELTPGKSTYRATILHNLTDIDFFHFGHKNPAQKRARTLALDKQRKALEAAHPIVTAPACNPDVDVADIRVSRPPANSTTRCPTDAAQTVLVEGPSSAQKHAHVTIRDKQQKAPEAAHPASVPSTGTPEDDAIDIDQPPAVAPAKRKRNWATASPASSNETGAPPVQPVAKRSKTSAAVRPMFSGLALPTPLSPPVTATPHSLRSPSLFTAHSPDLTSPLPAETAVSLDHRPTVVSQQGTTKRMSTSSGKKKGKRKLVDLAAEDAAKDRLIANLHGMFTILYISLQHARMGSFLSNRTIGTVTEGDDGA